MSESQPTADEILKNLMRQVQISQVQINEEPLETKIREDFLKYGGTVLADAASEATLPNGQNVWWAATAKDDTILSFAIAFKDQDNRLVTAYLGPDGRLQVGHLRENGQSAGGVEGSYHGGLNDGRDIDTVFQKAREMMTAVAEELALSTKMPLKYKDDFEKIQEMGSQPGAPGAAQLKMGG